MTFRWDDRYAEDDDGFQLGAPSPHAPEGQELIGAHTPLGPGRMRWSDSGKAWIVGEDFDLPMTHFEPSTLKPIFGPIGGRQGAGQPSALPGTTTWDYRSGRDPRSAIDEMAPRNPRPWEPQADSIKLYESPESEGGIDRYSKGEPTWPTDSRGRSPLSASIHAGHQPAEPVLQPILMMNNEIKPKGFEAEDAPIRQSLLSAQEPAAAQAQAQANDAESDGRRKSVVAQASPATEAKAPKQPKGLLHQSPATYTSLDDAALAIAPQVESMKGQIKGWGDWEVSGEISGLDGPHAFNVWQGGPEGFDFTATPNIAAAYHFHYRNKAGSVNDTLSDDRKNRTKNSRDGDVQGAIKMMKYFKREVPMYLYYYNDRDLLNIKFFPHPATNPDEFRWVLRRPGS